MGRREGVLVMILTLPVIVTRSLLGDSEERKAMRSVYFTGQLWLLCEEGDKQR